MSDTRIAPKLETKPETKSETKPRAGRQHQIIVGNAPTIRDHLFAREIDTRHLGQHDFQVALAADDVPDRRRDIGG